MPTGAWPAGSGAATTLDWTGYVAACGCGWRGSVDYTPTEDGEELAVEAWRRAHAEPLLDRQASRRRGELTRVLDWLGAQRDRLEDPAALQRINRAVDRARDLVADVQRDLERQAPERRPIVSGERPPAAWSDRRIAEQGRAICQQRSLPTHPSLAAEQAAVLEEWARRWCQRGPRDIAGQVELGLIGEVAEELRRIAAGLCRQPSPQREADGER